MFTRVGQSNKKMISGSVMMFIAQLTRKMNDPVAKQYISDNWMNLREKSKTEDDAWGTQLIEAILTEQIEEISKFI